MSESEEINPRARRGRETAARLPDSKAGQPTRQRASAPSRQVDGVAGTSPRRGRSRRSAAAPPVDGPSPPAVPVEPDGAPRPGVSSELSILLVSSEAQPFAKTGGLGDVAGALPFALARLGHQVTLVLPRYRSVPLPGEAIAQVPITIGSETFQAGFFAQELAPGARAVLVDCPRLYDRDGLYGVGGHDFADNPLRFALLARAALAVVDVTGTTVHIVHAHDWQSGLVPVYLRTRYRGHPDLSGVPAVFTMHNLAYQGLFDKEWMTRLDLDWRLFTLDKLEHWDRLSFLKGGIAFSERLTTVSRRYAQEILTPAFGFGFESVLRARREDLSGILNGIDDEVWDPARDRHLPAPYDWQDLSGKAASKRAVLERYGLPHEGDALDRPVIGMIARMVDQKGLDLVAQIVTALPHLGATFVVLGTGEPWFQDMWRQLARDFPDRFGVRIGFDEPVAHLVEAGADLFLMPSRFEPCGLNQMYSLRYGTVPLVRATGGLDDTVINYDPATGEGNGFKFFDYTATALLGTLRWALATYRDKAVWHRLQVAGMREDFSWNASARKYVKVYREARAARGTPVLP